MKNPDAVAELLDQRDELRCIAHLLFNCLEENQETLATELEGGHGLGDELMEQMEDNKAVLLQAHDLLLDHPC